MCEKSKYKYIIFNTKTQYSFTGSINNRSLFHLEIPYIKVREITMSKYNKFQHRTVGNTKIQSSMISSEVHYSAAMDFNTIKMGKILCKVDKNYFK